MILRRVGFLPLKNPQKTYIIAEAGINHQRSLDMAIRLANAAQLAGADVVKFQLEYPTEYTLTWEETATVYRHCEAIGIPFACTAFDVASLEFLLAETKMEFLKIASCDAQNADLIAAIDAANLPIIQSLKRGDETIAGNRQRHILHVVAEYPTPPDRADLMRVKEPCIDGLSDHSEGIGIPVAAVALGAKIIEKHLTLSRSLPGPDHASSLSPCEFAQMVGAIRDVESALRKPTWEALNETNPRNVDGGGEG